MQNKRSRSPQCPGGKKKGAAAAAGAVAMVSPAALTRAAAGGSVTEMGPGRSKGQEVLAVTWSWGRVGDREEPAKRAPGCFVGVKMLSLSKGCWLHSLID